MSTSKERIKSLQALVGANPDGIIGNETLTKFQCTYDIPTKAMVAHFFGNVDHESGGFSIVEESGAYSAQRLLAVFPKYFKSLEEAKKFERNAEAIFNRTYGGRMGNTEPGDGYKFRGRGFIQLTGKSNYSRFKEFIGDDVVSNPDLVATKYAMESAIFFFTSNNIWSMANDISDASIEKVRRRVNGGINGLADVRNKVKKYYAMFR